MPCDIRLHPTPLAYGMYQTRCWGGVKNQADVWRSEAGDGDGLRRIETSDSGPEFNQVVARESRLGQSNLILCFEPYDELSAQYHLP